MFRFCFSHFLRAVIESGTGPADFWSQERFRGGTEAHPAQMQILTRNRSEGAARSTRYEEVALSSPRFSFI